MAVESQAAPSLTSGQYRYDFGLFLEAIAGHDPDDEATTQRPCRYRRRNPAGGRFWLAVPAGVLDGTEPGVHERFQEALAALGQAADIEVVELPDLPYVAAATTIFLAESASVMEELIESGITAGLTAPEARVGICPSIAMLATDYLWELRRRRTIGVAIDGLLSRYVALLSPTRLALTPPAG